jgi:hypothetical protein
MRDVKDSEIGEMMESLTEWRQASGSLSDALVAG